MDFFDFLNLDVEELAELASQYGALFYPITFIWTFLEGETFVIFAGFAAAQDLIDPWLLLASAWLGSFSGDQFYFYIGRRYGGRLLARFPRWRPGVDLALAWLRRYNVGFILSFRFIYGVRNFSSFAMGMSGLPWTRFFVLNFIAAGLWASSFVGIGYLLGHALEAVLGNLARDLGIAMLGVFVLIMLVMFALHRLQKRRLAAPPGVAGAGLPPS